MGSVRMSMNGGILKKNDHNIPESSVFENSLDGLLWGNLLKGRILPFHPYSGSALSHNLL